MQDKPQTARFGTTLFLDNPLHRQAWEILSAIPAGQRTKLALSGAVPAGTAGAIPAGPENDSPNGAAKQLLPTNNFAAAASRERRR